jgi:hypothetical protein
MRSTNLRKTILTMMALLICSILSKGLAGATQPSVVNIKLNGMEIHVDARTGSIVYLYYPATGTILKSNPALAGLVDLAYPIEAFTPLRLASRFSAAKVSKETNGIRISWARLGPSPKNVSLPAGKVSAQVTIRAADDGRSVILSCQIENRSSAPIPQILFPDLWGLKPFDGMKRTELRLTRGVVHPFMVPYRQPQTAPPYYSDTGWKEYPAGGGYAENALRWIDYGSLKGGLSVFQRKWGTPDRPDVLTYRSETDPTSLRLTWQHKTTIEPGQTWNSGEFWITPHPGGWAKGIEVFRHYVWQVNPPRKLPSQIRDGLGFQTIWMTQAPETDPSKAYFRFTDLPRVAQDARQYDLHELVPWFWSSYFLLPIPIRKDLGTTQEFLDGIQQARRLGVNVAPFFSIHIIRNTQVAKYGVKPSHDNWTYHPELIPQFRPYYTHILEGTFVDDDNPLWQRDALAGLTEWVKRGVTSMSFDQFSYKLKGDQTPALIKLISKVRELARSKDPNSTFASESNTDMELDSPILDYTWNWVDYVNAGPLVNVLRSPRLNCNIDSSTLEAKKCFAEDLFLNVMPSRPDLPNGTALVSEKPALAATLKELARLRKQFLPFFTDGTFLGDSVLCEPAPALVRGYELGKKLLLIVLNNKAYPTRVGLQSDLRLWISGSISYETKYYDSAGKLINAQESQGRNWSGSTQQLQPGDLAVIEISAR